MYVALKSFKVKQADGSYRMTKPGEPVPEAVEWRNPKAYIERRWICLEEDYGKSHRRHFSAKKAVAVKVEKPAPAAAPPPPEPEPEPEPEAEEETEDDGEKYSEKELNAKSKKELQEIAELLDIDPSQNKADLVDCILAVQE